MQEIINCASGWLQIPLILESNYKNMANKKFRLIIKTGYQYFSLFVLGMLLLNGLIAQNRYAQGLRAILIVGHQEEGTQKAIRAMNEIADLFETNGVQVYKFYDDQANWQDIVSYARNCNFLVYSGHGSTMGTAKNAGGICISSMVPTAQLIRELRLQPNALVVFKSVCYGAGSSAGDDYDIGLSEAKKRVYHYAYPFFDIGAMGYYADNWGNGAKDFIQAFLAGGHLKDIYYKQAVKWNNIESEDPFDGYYGKRISISSSDNGGISTRTTYVNGVKSVEQIRSPKSYDAAFAGNPDFSIFDMRR